MKKIFFIFVSIIFLSNTGNAATCDDVLYIAWNGINASEEVSTEKWNIYEIRFPFYMGSLCLNGKKLKFFPHNDDFPLNNRVNSYVNNINGTSSSAISVWWRDRYEGNTDGEKFLYKFLIMKSHENFTKYIPDYFADNYIVVIRKESNSEPDLKWTPKFKYQISYEDLKSRDSERHLYTFEWE